MRITQKKLNVIIASHGKWLRDELGGQRANLRNANLRNNNLRDTVLCNADLRNADLSDADLCNADLRNAGLCNANLIGANLRNADLIGANLRSANLIGADLSGAHLSGANLDDYVVQVVRIGSRKGTTTYNATTDNVTCGCWNEYKGGTLAEFTGRVERVYGDKGITPNEKYYTEYMAAIAFFKAIKRWA